MADPQLSADQGLAAWLEPAGDMGRSYPAFLEQHRGGPQRRADLGTVAAAEIRAHLTARRSGDRPLGARSIGQTLAAIRTFHAFLDRRCGVPAAQLALV